MVAEFSFVNFSEKGGHLSTEVDFMTENVKSHKADFYVQMPAKN